MIASAVLMHDESQNLHSHMQASATGKARREDLLKSIVSFRMKKPAKVLFNIFGYMVI